MIGSHARPRPAKGPGRRDYSAWLRCDGPLPMRPVRCSSSERGDPDRDCDQRRGRRCPPTSDPAKAARARPKGYLKVATILPARGFRSPSATRPAPRSGDCEPDWQSERFADWWKERCSLGRERRSRGPLAYRRSARGSLAGAERRWPRPLEWDSAKPMRSPRGEPRYPIEWSFWSASDRLRRYSPGWGELPSHFAQDSERG